MTQCRNTSIQHKRIADLGEVVYRAVVNISPHRFIFGPSRAIREADLASHRHLAAHLAHLPYCSSHAVSIVEIERRKARREWRDLVAGIEGGQRFGSNGLQFGQGLYYRWSFRFTLLLETDEVVYVVEARPGGLFPGS